MLRLVRQQDIEFNTLPFAGFRRGKGVFIMLLREARDGILFDCECRHLAKGSIRNYRAETKFLMEFLELKQITEVEDVSIPRTQSKALIGSCGRLQNPRAFSRQMTVCWKCCIWRWWILRKSGQVGGRTGAASMRSCPSISLSVCRINTCCGGMSRVYERLRRPWHSPLPALCCC